MSDSAHSRRVFLGGSLAAGAGLALFGGDASGPARLEWCVRPAFPMAPRTVWFVRGDLPKGAEALLELWVEGPELPVPLRIAEAELVLSAPVTRWDVRMAWTHPELVPGEYRYRPLARVADRVLEGPWSSYPVIPFTFGV